MAQRGYERIGIWGSSLGAVRVVLAQAKNQDPNVAAVIFLAPLRFSHEYYSECEMEDEHLRNYEDAKALVDAGRGHEIMFVDFPNPGAYFSADVYLDRHCSEHYDITKGIHQRDRVPPPHPHRLRGDPPPYAQRRPGHGRPL